MADESQVDDKAQELAIRIGDYLEREADLDLLIDVARMCFGNDDAETNTLDDLSSGFDPD